MNNGCATIIGFAIMIAVLGLISLGITTCHSCERGVSMEQAARDDNISRMESENKTMDRENAANKSQRDRDHQAVKAMKNAWNKND